jgi:uncharacterized protein
MPNYLSPGVYVEEIPSAMQPIAGVGTNTVGFIGIVPDTFQCLVPVSDATYQQRLADKEKELAPVTKEELQKQVKDLQAKIEQGKQDRQKAAKPAAEGAKPAAEGAKPAAEGAKPAAEGAKPAAEGAKPAAEGAKPAEAAKPADAEKIKQLDAEIKANSDKCADAQAQLDNFDNLQKRAELAVSRYDVVDFKPRAPVADSKLCTNFTEFVRRFGPAERADGAALECEPVPIPLDDNDVNDSEGWCNGHRALTLAVDGFFKNGGTRCFVARVQNAAQMDLALKDFESIDEISIVAAPGMVGDDGAAPKDVWDKLVGHCEKCRDRFAILDSTPDVEDANHDIDVQQLTYASAKSALPGRTKSAAFYFPWIQVMDPAKQIQDRAPSSELEAKHRGKIYVPPSGHIAGVYARTDEERGVHKAPANVTVRGAMDLKYYVSKQVQDLLNPQGVNCIRNLNGNITVWGARTIGGDANGEWKYLSVRRFYLYLAESIDEGTQWVVFEPNDTTLWSKIRRNVRAFLTNTWRSGALFGATPEQAFYVKCDEETNPPEVRDVGQVVTEIGVAIVRPAEFVIFRITQAIGQPAAT